MPGMGAHYDHDHPALAELPYFTVSRFPKYLIFYRAVSDGIQVVRVLHGARDMASILAEELGVDQGAGDDTGESEG
jgi:toxin ParE1/3/4